jgi:L-arabinose isomerase
LPLYLKLYDDVIPDLKPRFSGFLDEIIKKIEAKGIGVLKAQICREKKEFDEAIKIFEKEDVDAIITLHLSYSPSLESADALSRTRLPVIIFDTTPRYDFSVNTKQNDIMMNHGIHGVQDLCNLLKRKGKYFSLVTGYWGKPDVLDKIVKKIKGALIAGKMRKSRIGNIGGYFKGMGDFIVEDELIKRCIGTEIVRVKPADIVSLMPAKGEKSIKEELEKDLSYFKLCEENKKNHLDSIIAGLGVRRWVRREKLSCFTMNFSTINYSTGFPTIPFLEASKAMAGGIGYAGEGDIITSALVGSLLSVFPQTTFTEMFCPDWKNEIIFLSHMGEVNLNLVTGKPKLIRKEMPFIDIEDPVIAVGQLKKGKATFVNLSPSKESFNLIVSNIEMIEKENKNIEDTVTGWFRTNTALDKFLLDFSNNGGSHHSAIVYGNVSEEIKEFGSIMGFSIAEI